MRSWIIRNGGAHRAEHKPVVLNGRGTASEIRQPQGERRPKLLNPPKTPKGGTASEITGNGSVLGCSPHEVLDNTERRRSQSQAQACRSQWEGNDVRNSVFGLQTPLAPRGTASEIRQPQPNPRGNGVQNSVFALYTPLQQADRRPKFANPRGNGVRNS